MVAVETVPRLDLSDLRSLPGWERMIERGHVHLFVDGRPAEINLCADHVAARGGLRWWWSCPMCHSRRRHLFVLRGSVLCRRCHHLHYQEQLWPDTMWRRDVARPLLRAQRQATKE
jgi:hypothetical protein